ncbi:MAG: hypothetical protein WCF78_00155 [archaeon]
MIKSNKAQSSVEILIGIFFIIFFIYIFNILAEDTVATLEINKIKEQEQEIILSLSDFLYSGTNVLTDQKFNITDYNASYKIPVITIPSQKPTCEITISNLEIKIVTTYNNKTIFYRVTNQIPADSYDLTSEIVKTCGSELFCYNDANILRCD